MAEGFPRIQRRLHWWTAALVAGGFTLGLVMRAVPLRDLLSKFLLFQAHKTVGLIVLGLVILRLAVRVHLGRPTPAVGLRRWEVTAASLGQGLLYALLLAVPVLGYMTACTAPARVPTLFLFVIPIPSVIAPNPRLYALLRVLHRDAAFALLGLAVGHALAAFRHHFAGREVLLRMWRG